MNFTRRIHSIELSEEYHKMVSYRLSPYPHIYLHLGNSGDIMPDIIKALNKPALIWLDAHYGSYGDAGAAIGDEDCPIFKELSHIYENSKGIEHQIVIDDANIFEAEKSDYPSIDRVRKFLVSKEYASDLIHDREHDCLIVVN